MRVARLRPVCLAAALLSACDCTGGTGGERDGGHTAEVPSIVPGTTAWADPVTATVACASAGCLPYLTTDGSTPTTASPQRATARFDQTGILKAICAGPGWTTSPVASATYTIGGSSGFLTHGFRVAPGHPRLWWNAARLAQAQGWLAAHPFSPGASDHLETAWKHVVAGTSCATAVAWAAGWAPPPAQVTPTASGSDDMRWYAEDAMLAFDWCYDQWTSAQRAAFVDHMNAWVGNVEQQAWGGLYDGVWMAQSNYFWGNLRNELEWGIVSYGENGAGPGSLADGFIDHALSTRWAKGFVPTATGSAAGGGTDEGGDYGATIFQYPIIPLATVDLGGRDLFGETPYFKEGVYWVVYGTTPAPTYNVGPGTSTYTLNPFADEELFADGGTLSQRTYYQDFMTFAANAWGALGVGKHARQWMNTVGAALPPADRHVRAQDQATPAAPFTTLPLDYYATGLQYLFGRKAWDASSTYFMWQMGTPALSGHNHVDAGNFNLWRGGRWLSRETTGYANAIAGYGYKHRASDDTSSIIAHNGLVFGTALYDDDVRLMPSVPRGSPVVRRLESAAAYAYADVDLTSAYRWSDGYAAYDRGAVIHVERELLFLRALEATVVFDRLTTGDVTRGPDAGTRAADEVNTFVIHFETPPALEDATHLTATNGAQALRVTTLVPSSPAARRVVTEGGAVGQYRVEIDTAGAAQRYFLHVLQARDAGAADLVASVADSAPSTPGAGTFTVTLHPSAGADTVLILEKGQTSSGGSLSLAGAAPVALRTGVQPITYTDAGPAW